MSYLDRRSSCKRKDRTTGVGSMLSLNRVIRRVFTLAGLLSACSVVSLCSQITKLMSLVMTPSSGGILPWKQRRDTSSMKNVLHRCLYWLWSLTSFLKWLKQGETWILCSCHCSLLIYKLDLKAPVNMHLAPFISKNMNLSWEHTWHIK